MAAVAWVMLMARVPHEQAKQNKEKYVGVSSDDMKLGGSRKGGYSSGGFGSSGLGASTKLDSDFDSKLKLGREGSDTTVRCRGAWSRRHAWRQRVCTWSLCTKKQARVKGCQPTAAACLALGQALHSKSSQA